ncbi:MAG: four helix bundle protein [Elusimicrobia bacterium]|nr:four helix bundle protein [Elusimicrobiota bacterium]
MKEDREYIFDFEKLDVYQKALQFVNRIYRVYNSIGKEYQYSIGIQFTRAGLSVVNNIAEGSGKKSKKGKIQFYGIALSSARECVPMITLLLTEKQISKEEYSSLRSACVYICNMLGKLIRVINE